MNCVTGCVLFCCSILYGIDKLRNSIWTIILTHTFLLYVLSLTAFWGEEEIQVVAMSKRSRFAIVCLSFVVVVVVVVNVVVKCSPSHVVIVLSFIYFSFGFVYVYNYVHFQWVPLVHYRIFFQPPDWLGLKWTVRFMSLLLAVPNFVLSPLPSLAVFVVVSAHKRIISLLCFFIMQLLFFLRYDCVREILYTYVLSLSVFRFLSPSSAFCSLNLDAFRIECKTQTKQNTTKGISSH